MDRDGTYTIKTTEISLQILDALKELDGAGVTELSDHLRMSKSSVFKHLQTLQEKGLVSMHNDEYRIGLLFFNYGTYAREQTRLFRIAKTDVDWLADTTGAWTSLVAKENRNGVVVYGAEGDESDVSDPQTGDYFPLHQNAMGKVILSQAPESEWMQYIEMTENDELDNEDRDFIEELRTIDSQGVASDDNPTEANCLSIAAPVFDSGNQVVGSIGVSASSKRINRAHMNNTFRDVVMSAAQKITKRLQLSDNAETT